MSQRLIYYWDGERVLNDIGRSDSETDGICGYRNSASGNARFSSADNLQVK